MAEKIVPLHPHNQTNLNVICKPHPITATRDESLAAGHLLTQLQTHLDEPAASVHGTLGHIMTHAAEATDVKIDYPLSDQIDHTVMLATLHSQAQLAAIAFRVTRINELTPITSDRVMSIADELDSFITANRRLWYMYFAVTLMHMERALEYLKANGWDMTDAVPLRNNALCVEFERITSPSHVYRLYLTFRSFLLMK